MKRKLDFSRHVPPGFNADQEVLLFLWGYGASVVFALRFLWRYFYAFGQLYGYENNVYGMLSDARMPSFAALMEDIFLLFPVLALCILLWIAYHYAYHWQGSRSIYLMRRLPSRWELHRRCLTVPALGLVICAVTIVILFFLFYALYMLVTPDVVLVPGQLEMIWSVM